MHARYFTIALLASAASVLASPFPTPTPTIEARQDTAGDVLDSVIGDVSSVASGASSVASSIASGASSVASDVGDAVTSGAVELFTEVSTRAGEAITVVSNAAGEAITLATDNAGIATSTLGGWYTIATDSVRSAAADVNDRIDNDNAASKPLLVGAASVVGSVLLGAYITL